jgi:uncharacterized protein YxjI
MDGYFFQLKNDRFYMMDSKGNTIMQIPEGYMPARSDFYNDTWYEWKKKHINQTQ